MKRFVCFDDEGNIYKVSREPDDRFKFIECDFEDVRQFIEGQWSLLDYKVEYDFIDKQYKIKNQKQVDEDKLMWSFIYEIPTTIPKNKQIVFTKDNTQDVWRLTVDPAFEADLREQGIAVDISNYYFSITKKGDPNVLYRLIRFVDGNEVSFEHAFEIDDTEVSVYTMRRFDTYHYEEIHG